MFLYSENSTMKVFTRGDGEPELVVVGSVHGDEPAGRNAIEKLLEEEPEFKKPVKFIVANEEALEENERYLEADLNSSFPGKRSSDKHEERLATELGKEIEGKTVLDIHTTHSTEKPFATMKDMSDKSVGLVRSTDVDNAVYFPEDSGVLIEQAENGIIVETGPQGTEKASKDAYSVMRNFLVCQGVLEGRCTESHPDFYRYFETVEGDWTFEAENFRLVEKGEVYATRDGEELVAEEDFYPALMSTNGYNGKLGYKTEKIK